MSISEPFPLLPLELNQRILNETAQISSPSETIQLMLVSRMAYDRISYMFYQSIILTTPSSFEGLKFLVEMKGPSFFALRTRAVFVRMRPRTEHEAIDWNFLWNQLIPNLTKLNFLETWSPTDKTNNSIKRAVLLALQSLPNLEHLALNAAFMLDPFVPGSLSIANSCESITHLKWFDSRYPVAYFVEMIAFLPNLTHFLLPFLTQYNMPQSEKLISLAEAFTHLKIFIVAPSDCPDFDYELASHYSNVVVMENPNQLFHMEGSLARFIETVGRDDNSVWQRAEKIILDRGFSM
ncbi:hypothetical protein DL96DRAFT_1685970 [Flagelloscypha sp. PMI_526]|nr:hypothetical protein DL96DRAFT_1685970 [Flagelloscypha sp. PMI_526]